MSLPGAEADLSQQFRDEMEWRRNLLAIEGGLALTFLGSGYQNRDRHAHPVAAALSKSPCQCLKGGALPFTPAAQVGARVRIRPLPPACATQGLVTVSA